MKKFTYTLLFLLVSFNVFAQTDSTEKNNSFFLELGGVSGIYSFSYQRSFSLNKHFGLAYRIGATSIPGTWYDEFGPTSVVDLSVFYKFKKKNKIFAGYGAGFVDASFSNLSIFWELGDNWNQAFLGYRRSFKKDGFFIGATFNLIIWDIYEYEYFPFGGIQFGYNFNKIEHKSISSKRDNSAKETISGIIAPVFPKIRFQYEKSKNLKYSYGANFAAYLGWENFRGIRLEAFGRRYADDNGYQEGWFAQSKAGLGLFGTTVADIKEKSILGFTVGAGVAGGYKVLIGNHLCLETILGLHYYIAPILFKDHIYGDLQTNREMWYSTVGYPLDFQFKVGWRY